MKTTTRFMLFDILLIAAALAAAAVMFLAEIHGEAKERAIGEQEEHLRVFWELLRSKGQTFSIRNGKLLVGDYVVNGNYELPDKLHEIFGCTATIFMGDSRVSTNVRKPDNSRAIGTRLDGAPRDAVFGKGKPYHGRAIILGVPYLTAYDPIRNGKGEVIGALYVGVRESTYFATYEKLRDRALLLTALLMIIFVSLGALLIRFRKKAVKVLTESETKYRQLFEMHSDAIMLIERENGEILDANASAVTLYGYARNELVGKRFCELVTDPEMRYSGLEGLDEHIPLSYHGKKDGTTFPVEMFTASFTWKQHAVLIAAIRDITERKMLQDELRELSERDPLTSLYNRRKLYQLLALEIKRTRRQNSPLALMLMDLDHFKAINDTFGHDIGDVVLRNVAQLVSVTIRATDIVARYGGEEFVVVCPDTDLEGAAVVADKIRSVIEGHRFPSVGSVTISIGISSLKSGDTADEIIKRADQMLYIAKKMGRNRVMRAT
jgi:diguanylate cyclase (GGDEF)-like protein/PAS domain S-box-containing protein